MSINAYKACRNNEGKTVVDYLQERATTLSAEEQADKDTIEEIIEEILAMLQERSYDSTMRIKSP